MDLERACATRSGNSFSHGNSDYLNVATLVPIPPSKAKTDPLCHDRITRMLHAIRPQPPIDVRELVLQTESQRGRTRQATLPPLCTNA